MLLITILTRRGQSDNAVLQCVRVFTPGSARGTFQGANLLPYLRRSLYCLLVVSTSALLTDSADPSHHFLYMPHSPVRNIPITTMP